jgi:hypothetical protein
MVRYGDYAPPRAMALNVFEEMRFEGAWLDAAGGHPLGEMWRDVVAAGVMFGVGLSEMVGLIPVVFDGPDDREPFLVWDRFCSRLWDRVDVVPGLVAA